eukprot:1128393-Karenia_brevis.AAC.1
MHTTLGTVAGAPLADVTFVVAISRVLQTLRQELRNRNLIHEFSISDPDAFTVASPQALHEVSFVDDCALPVLAPAPQLVSNISKVVSISVSVFAWYSMQFNFNAGKSETLICGMGL